MNKHLILSSKEIYFLENLHQTVCSINSIKSFAEIDRKISTKRIETNVVSANYWMVSQARSQVFGFIFLWLEAQLVHEVFRLRDVLEKVNLKNK